MNIHLAQGGLGRGHGTNDLRWRRWHLEHRDRGGARALLAQQRYAPLAARTGEHSPSLAPSSARTHHAAATRAPSTARMPTIARVATHTPPQQQPQPHRAAARASTPHCAPHAPRALAQHRRRQQRRRTADTTHERRRTSTKRCCMPTRAQSRRRRSMGRWGTAELGRRPGNGVAAFLLPCERGSHS